MGSRQTKKSMRPWAVLIGCCLLCGFGFSLPLPSFGVFITPMVEHFGSSVTAVNLYFTFMTGAAVISCAFGARILEKNMRATVVICSFAMGLAFVALAAFPSVPMVWVAGTIEGLCYPLVASVLVPIAINNWFHKQQATFTGIAFAMIGAFGVAFGPALTALIGTLGWQMALVLVGIAIFVVCASVGVFLLRQSPEQVGGLPYDASEAAPVEKAQLQATSALTGPDYSRIFGTFAFVLVMASAALSGFLGDFNTQINAITQKSGFDPTTAGLTFSAASAGLLVGKIALGWVKDHFGGIKAVALGCTVGVLAFTLFVLGINGRISLLYAGAFLSGLCTCLGTMAPAIIASDAFGKRAYAKGVAHATAACNLGMAIGTPLYSLVFDTTGSYTPIIIACAIVPIAVYVTGLIGIQHGHKIQQQALESITSV